jgi:hypothetical protein
MVGRPDTASMVQAKYPALRFKQQLTAYVEKIYGIMRDNLEKEISPFLTMCIQVQQLSHFNYEEIQFSTIVNFHRLQ